MDSSSSRSPSGLINRLEEELTAWKPVMAEVKQMAEQNAVSAAETVMKDSPFWGEYP